MCTSCTITIKEVIVVTYEEVYQAVIIEGTSVFNENAQILQDFVTKKTIVQYCTDRGTVELLFDRFEAAYAVFEAMSEEGTVVQVINEEEVDW